jgi:rod shape-determining protein MreD
MKLLGTFLLLIAVTLLIRSTALTSLAARGIVIDALAFATVVWALRYGESWGTGFGFALGLAADLDAAHWLGRHSLILALVGYVVGRSSHSLVRESPGTQIVLLFFVTLVHQAWIAAFDFGGVIAVWPMLTRVLSAALVTAPIGTLLLVLLRIVTGTPLFGHASTQSDTSA